MAATLSLSLSHRARPKQCFLFCFLFGGFGGPGGGCLCSSKSSGKATTETIKKKVTTRTTKTTPRTTKNKTKCETPAIKKRRGEAELKHQTKQTGSYYNPMNGLLNNFFGNLKSSQLDQDLGPQTSPAGNIHEESDSEVKNPKL